MTNQPLNPKAARAKEILDIIFENEHFVVVNKPAGLLSIPDREQTEVSLKDLLIKKYGSIYTVHRLDKETSGIILFAKNEETHKYFSRKFEEKSIEKYYIGVVYGSLFNESGTIDAPIIEHPTNKGLMVVHKKGKPSLTTYTVLEDFGKFSLVKFQIHTGRTHQIRVHAKNIGHPIVCDPLYADGKPILLSTLKKKFKLSKHDEEERPMLNRVALHSFQLIFSDADEKHYDLTADIPKDIKAFLQQMRKLKNPVN
jgi:23S rRNA pseudouridine1911/1915/1917 synthase